MPLAFSRPTRDSLGACLGERLEEGIDWQPSTMVAEPQQVLVGQLLDAEEMRGIAQAALEETIALVTLDEPPPVGEFVLELHAPGTRPVVILAVSAGEPMAPMYPVRVRPFDDEHYGQLLAFVCSTEGLCSQPATRWSQGFERKPSLLRLDTIPKPNADGVAGERKSVPVEDPLLDRPLASGKYRIESLIGEGSAGAVYRGRHLALDKALAIKVLHPRFRADQTFALRFLAEARAASRLDHLNVTRVQDFGEEPDGLLYIVMELLDGVDLRHLIVANELPRSRRIDILVSVLNALAAADDQSIVHRDIKPENVMVVEAQDDDGEAVDLVKVCDFGLATVKPRVAGGTDIRQAAAAMSWVAGTPEYMSPEQILGQDLDIRSDLYACGIILFELLTNKLPFENPSVMHLMRQHLYDPPPQVRSFDRAIDVRLEALVQRALSKSPDDRPSTPREFRNALREATSSSPQPTNTITLEPSGGKTLPAMQRLREPSTNPDQVADRILADISSVITALTGESTEQQFVRRLRAIVSAYPVLLERGAFTALADIAITLVHMSEEPALGDDPRPGLSMRALEPLRHETRLAKVSLAYLSGTAERRDDARVLLSLGGPAGLRALVDARRNVARGELDRVAFVSMVRVLVSDDSQALISILSEVIKDAGGEPTLVEDLLAAVPSKRNVAFRPVVEHLVHHGSADVRRVTMQCLPDLLGDEAHRYLRAATRDPDESVRIAAVNSLRLIGGVDEAVIGLAQDLLSDRTESSVEMRVAVAEALQDVVSEYRSDAIRVLNQALFPKSRSLMNVLLKSGVGFDEPMVLIAVARTLIGIAGMEGRTAVERRVAASRGPLREELEQVLR